MLQFLHSESGAATVDWVVLSAAMVAIGLAMAALIYGGVEDMTDDVNDVLESDDVIKTRF